MRLIQRNVDQRGISVVVRGCFWGDAEGARLWANGRSVPGYEETGGMEASEADQIAALWLVLYTDPWYELRLLRNLPTSGQASFGQEAPSSVLLRTVDEFTPSIELMNELSEEGLDEYFQDALSAIRQSPELRQAAATATLDSLDHRRAIARALIAYAIVSAQDCEELPPTGFMRDALAERVADELYGFGMSFSDFLMRPVKGMATRLVSRKLAGDRGSITDAAAPMAGDVLRFLANGDGMRSFVLNAIKDSAAGPVYVLAHSLGGIICVDLLVREEVPAVKCLVTIGSQAPFLYEIGALPSLTYPKPLPGHFPPWANIYDRRDILSYIGSPIMGERIADIQVDNGEAFPQAHSAYWSNPAVWDVIAAVVT